MEAQNESTKYVATVKESLEKLLSEKRDIEDRIVLSDAISLLDKALEALTKV